MIRREGLVLVAATIVLSGGVVTAAVGPDGGGTSTSAHTAPGALARTAPVARTSSTPVRKPPPRTRKRTAPAALAADMPEASPPDLSRAGPEVAAVRGADACSGPGWQQRRGQAALSSLRPVAGNGYRVRFLSAEDGFLGLTTPSSSTVEVYVRSCSAQSPELLRHVLAHELGHVHDLTRLSPAQREAWMAARGIHGATTWFGCDRCTDFATPAGDFAEVYAQWLRGATSNRSQLGDAPSREELDDLAKRFFGG